MSTTRTHSASHAQRDESSQQEIIVDRNSKGGAKNYIKGRFLGKGGFAKVYEFT